MPDLVAGVNTIDVDAIDYGDGTYFAMQIQGNPGNNAVPDGGSAAMLLGISSFGLAFLRRKLA